MLNDPMAWLNGSEARSIEHRGDSGVAVALTGAISLGGLVSQLLARRSNAQPKVDHTNSMQHPAQYFAIPEDLLAQAFIPPALPLASQTSVPISLRRESFPAMEHLRQPGLP